MKTITTVLTLVSLLSFNVNQAVAGGGEAHTHGNRTHTHPLPVLQGLNHQHGNGAVGHALGGHNAQQPAPQAAPQQAAPQQAAAPQPQVDNGPTLLSQGSLSGAFSSSLKGDFQIIKSNGRTFIELGDNFKAKKGPDVKVFLSPLNAASITGSNASNGSTFIQKVSIFKGKSRIEIPANVNLANFKSLVFHCEKFSKLWGTSAL